MSQILLQPATQELPSEEIISLEACKKHVEKFQLADERVVEIRNNMIGIVNSILNAYLSNFE
jgi:hypothetical protein